ncbi:hypothetical protein [Phycicoccus mangrovi]|uniref:hypothetical protein n=1 Tax=Phycicoccus mangrovi TaxID=2840470 RepID=UPI001C0087D2|nr:hypothetical protein [Phycicoccus mangrovi]MBT9257431.1 hypothetical protein [Phycicoccus mangrovi]
MTAVEISERAAQAASSAGHITESVTVVADTAAAARWRGRTGRWVGRCDLARAC